MTQTYPLAFPAALCKDRSFRQNGSPAGLLGREGAGGAEAKEAPRNPGMEDAGVWAPVGWGWLWGPSQALLRQLSLGPPGSKFEPLCLGSGLGARSGSRESAFRAQHAFPASTPVEAPGPAAPESVLPRPCQLPWTERRVRTSTRARMVRRGPERIDRRRWRRPSPPQSSCRKVRASTLMHCQAWVREGQPGRALPCLSLAGWRTMHRSVLAPQVPG